MFYIVWDLGLAKYVLRVASETDVYNSCHFCFFVLVFFTISVLFCAITVHCKADSCEVIWDACFVLYMK